MRILYHHRTQAEDGQAIHIRAMIDAFESLGHEVAEVSLVKRTAAREGRARGQAAEQGSNWGWVTRLPRFARELAEYGYNDDEYLLATDTAVVVPVGKVIVMDVTGADGIHSWTIPAFGVKQDAVPGRLAQLWFQAEKEGVYFGQCSELCGKDHAYMPITVKVVSEEAYEEWLTGAKEEYAGVPRSYQVASN